MPAQSQRVYLYDRILALHKKLTTAGTIFSSLLSNHVAVHIFGSVFCRTLPDSCRGVFMRPAVAILFALTTAAATAQIPSKATAPAAKTAESTEAIHQLPVHQVVLYKNGIGYFEHLGSVNGNQRVAIDFTSSQLNDVLQSLTILDDNGGRIGGVNYNSTTPLAEQLKSLSLPMITALGIGTLDQHRYFTISSSSTYDPTNQMSVIIREAGHDVSYEHLYDASANATSYVNGISNDSYHQ
jgi:hypothetical protein